MPGLGDALVPTLSRMGPSEEPLDTVLGIRWAAYSGEPLPVHAVDALGLRTGERLLHEALAEAIEALEGLDSPAWSTEQAAAVREAGSRGGDWGLPTGLHPGARRVLTRAASLVEAADLGLAPAVQHTVGVHSVTRERILTTLRRVAERTLAEATCVAALHLAGWRGPDRD